MKKIVIFLLVLIVIAGCHKSKDYLIDSSLYGKWELRRSSGGYPGATYNYPAGNGNTMIFRTDGGLSTTTVSPTGTTTQNGTYRTTLGTVNGQRQTYLHIQNNGGHEIQYNLTLRNDSLFIYPSGMADGFETLWVKQ